jgi:hypothetical protein
MRRQKTTEQFIASSHTQWRCSQLHPPQQLPRRYQRRRNTPAHTVPSTTPLQPR